MCQIADVVRLPSLPHLKIILVAAFERALDTWERFTSEFAIGGIDLASPAEKELAFMPSTNNVNEGALGSWRRFTRENPSSTIGHFNALATFARNDTQNFMDNHFESEDHQHLLREARLEDSSGVERKRRQELITLIQSEVGAKREKERVRGEKKTAEDTRLAAISIVSDSAIISKMTVKTLEDQLELHRRRGDKEIPLKSHMKIRQEKLEELVKAIS